MKHVPDGPFYGETQFGRKYLGDVKGGILHSKFTTYLKRESKRHSRCCQVSNDVTDSDLEGIDYHYSYESSKGDIIHKHRYQTLEQIRANKKVRCGDGVSRYLIIMNKGKKI